MSRLLTFILCVAVLVGAVHARVVEVREAQHGRHTEVRLLDYAVNRVAVIGDSYTTGGDQGGIGVNGWSLKTWRALAEQGIAVTPTVAAEGGAGYCTRGNRGSVFEDLTVRAVKPNDVLVVFFGSRNDIGIDPTRLSVATFGTLSLARQIARSAQLLVIGPPWPTPDPPAEILRIRDVLSYQAELADATFIDPIAARWFVGKPELIGSDGVHPTDAGHTYMAEKIAPLIANRLHPY